MFSMSGRAVAIRATMLAGAAAVVLGVLTAGAEAFPSAMAAPAVGGVEAVQYREEGFPHHRRHHRHHDRYGENAHPYHPGHAGLYDCGPGGQRTRLSRKACGGNDRFGHLRQPF